MTFASSGASSSPFSIERNFPQQVYWTCGGFWLFAGIEARPSSWRLRAGQTRRRNCFICFKRSCPEYYFIGAFGVVRAQLAYFACRSGSDTFLYLVPSTMFRRSCFDRKFRVRVGTLGTRLHRHNCNRRFKRTPYPLAPAFHARVSGRDAALPVLH